MRRLLLCAAALGLLATPASAMSLADFLAKAKALKAKGMMAMFSPDAKLLKAEMESVGTAYRAELEAARRARRKPHSCPPPKGQVKMSGQELFAEFEKIPPARRNISVKAAFYGVMARRYPCR